MLKAVIAGRWLTANGVVGFWPANARDEDIVLWRDESRTDAALVWHGLRQQNQRPPGKPNYALADFVAPVGGPNDYVGAFAVTAGVGIERKLAEFEAKKDDYSGLMLKAIADRLAEAFAEWLHRKVRRELWGYARDEALDNAGLIREEYRGIRPAPGYPACPDHAVKEPLFELLDAPAIGMTVTENFAMLPAASVSGFYLSHPDARYFAVGRIGDDQLAGLRATRGHRCRRGAAATCAQPRLIALLRRYNRRMVRTIAALCAYAALASAACAATVRLSHPYGELIDRGPVTAYFDASYPDQIDCTIAPAVVRAGNVITLTVRRVVPGAPVPQCLVPNQASLGELSAGWWTVVLRVLDANGPTLVEQYDSEWKIDRSNTLCGAHPQLRGSVLVEHATLSSDQLASRIAQDPAFAARMLHPSQVQAASTFTVLYYGALDNPHDQRAALQATGEFRSVHANGLACFATSPPDAFGDVIEYFHAGLDHYFYAIDRDEIAGLDSGTGAKGWTRTRKSFRVLASPGCPLDRREAIAYRFFGKPGVGPSSHVFTVDRKECRIVDRSGAWLYESSQFWATPPNSSGACTHADELSLHRLWKPFGDSNHRFTTELAVVAEMEAKGWVHEGVAMCVKK